MVEIEEVAVQEEDLNDLSVTQLKKRMREKGIDASGCTEVAARAHILTTSICTPCLSGPTPAPTHARSRRLP